MDKRTEGFRRLPYLLCLAAGILAIGSAAPGAQSVLGGAAPGYAAAALSTSPKSTLGITWPLTVVPAGTGAGLVIGSPGPIDCGQTCTGQFASGTPVMLTASASAGSQFTGWLGPCTGMGMSCQFTVDAPTTLIATFAPASLNLQGILDIDGNRVYDPGTDGLLVTRYLFGMTGTELTDHAKGDGATRDDTAILDYLTNIRPLLDLDGDGNADPLTDGIVITRYLSGLRGESLFAGVLGSGATRLPSAIEAFLAGGSTPPVEPPPDPASVAPDVDPGVSSTLGAGTAFLYTGANPIQTGVVPGTIDPLRAAVLRGTVHARDGAPVPAVTITILSHPEYGQTLTRADGGFDLAVNGGGTFTVNYQKQGYLPVQRQVKAPWQDYAGLPDVVMIPLDPVVTTVTLGAGMPLQAARGSVMSDGDPPRQATVLFPADTQAQMVLPGGGTQPLSTLNVRATEFTVGANGGNAMPGALPATSGYTYAVELSVDEALSAGATSVTFSQPVPFYVENFVGFPVGSLVPMGFYDRTQGQWVAADNGRVIKVVGVTGGMADLDLNGDTVADNAAALAALGITDAERTKLATLYAPGQSLWRVLVPHFSPWDCNWPFGPPDGSEPPKPKPKPKDKPPKGPGGDCKGGSLIECETQTLGEVVDIAGTPFKLYYRSNRVPGRRGANVVELRLTGASLPAGLQKIHLEIRIAGREFKEQFAPSTNLVHTFTWDGNDAYGRPLQGKQPLTGRVGFEYIGQYYATADSFAASFNRFGGSPVTIARGGGAAVAFSRVNARVSSPPIILYQSFETEVGQLLMGPTNSLGGWTIDQHHAYDVTGKILYRGDGRRRGPDASAFAIATLAGGGASTADNVPATQASIRALGIVAGPDGSVYFRDYVLNKLRRIRPDGVIVTVAGGGTTCPTTPCGEGGPALQAKLNFASSPGIALSPDGSLYVLDGRYIRRIAPDGIITTIGGTGADCINTGECGDGGPARQAGMTPTYLSVGPDGSVYVSDSSIRRIRRISPDGIISSVAGSGSNCNVGLPCGDGGQATAATIGASSATVAAPDGSLYIVDNGSLRVRKVRPDGIIVNFAGNGTECVTSTAPCGDGGPATQAQFRGATDAALGKDGALYIAELNNARVRRVGPDGIITTVAGNGTIPGFAGDGGFPTAAVVAYPRALAVGPDGRLFIMHNNNDRIRVTNAVVPGLQVGEFPVASEDATEVFIFDNAGRHQRTLNAYTGAVRLQFAYDASGRLTSITDADGNVTAIQRNGSGTPTAIVAPGGQHTTLTINANGYLAAIANPAGETVQLTYNSGMADGLLATFTDARSHSYQFTYDALGRLVADQNPATGVTTLARTEVTDDRYKVTVTSPAGLATLYDIEDLPNGDHRRTRTDPAGGIRISLVRGDGSRKLTSPDGTVTDLIRGPDPRFGMQSPIVTSLVTTTPGAIVTTRTASRTVTLSSPSNPLSLTGQTDTVQVNGRTYARVYTGATRTFTLTTPAGRQHQWTIDTKGRRTQISLAGLTPLQRSYDSKGRLATLTHGARTSNFAYNPEGLLSQLTDPMTHSAAFAWDAAGRATQITRADTQAIHFAHDLNGNMVSVTPAGRTAHSFTYDSLDRLQSYAPPALAGPSANVQFAYNPDHKLTQVTRGGDVVTLGYDAAGRLQSTTTPLESVQGAYNAAGRLSTLGVAGGIGIAYTKDSNILKGTTLSGPVTGSVLRTFDNNRRLTGRTINGGNAQAFAYDLDGLLVSAGAMTLTRSAQNGLLTGTALGQVSDTRGYNGFGEWATYAASYSATPLYSGQYTRDAGGRITQLIETVSGVAATYAYDYDLVGRLIEVRKDGTTTSSYTYDANGNRLTRSGDVVAGATYDAQDRMTQYGTTAFAYTAAGDLSSAVTGAQTTNYSYDPLGNLRSVTLPGPIQIEYLIDGRNRRIGKQVNGTRVQGFLYQSKLQPIAELDGNNAIVSTFVYGSRPNVPDYMVKGGVTYRIIADHVGSPRLVVDTASGTIAQRMDYDEFGNVLQDTSPGFQPFGFAGGLYDRDTGLVRFGARDYDPRTGRFTAKDSRGLAGGLNLYAYANDDPVNFLDITGRNPAAAAAAGLGIGAASGASAGATLGLGATSAFIATVGLIGGPVAVAILAAAALIDSAQVAGDETGDDEGEKEGGAPPADGEVDGGDSCPVPDGPKTYAPTGEDDDVSPIGDTGLPERPEHDTDPTIIPGAGDPRNPTIPRPPKLPTFDHGFGF